MYSEHERPSTKRILITVGAVVAVIVVAIASAAVGINLMAPRYSPGGADRPARAEAQTPATETVSVPTAAPAPASPVTTQDVAPGASAAPAAAAPAPAAAPSPKPTADAGLGVVVIDAGHQGHGDSGLEPESPAKNAPMKPKVESGASGPYAPHEESEVNLQVALKLRDVLESRGVTVKMIRTTQNVDIPNSERAKMANAWHAALFIRLHCDSAASSVSGILTEVPAKNYYPSHPIVGVSATAGKLVQAGVLAATHAKDRGIRSVGDLTGFNWSQVPSVLVEMGLMSNRVEDRKLVTPSYQQVLAEGMSNGIIAFLKSR